MEFAFTVYNISNGLYYRKGKRLGVVDPERWGKVEAVDRHDHADGEGEADQPTEAQV